MWCVRARRLISAFHDQELDPHTELDVSAHVARCPRCCRELERVKRGAELAGIYRPADLTPLTRPQSMSPFADAVGAAGGRTSARLHFAAATLALLLGTGVVFRSPLHNLLWRAFSSDGDCTLDLGAGPRGGRPDPLDTLRARYSGRFREFPFRGQPGPGWVAFDYKCPSQVPARMSLKSVMVFDSGCCGSLGLVYAGDRRSLCLLQQPAERPMSLAGLTMDEELISSGSAAHGTVGRYSVHTWTADRLRYVLLSDLPRQEIEATVASLRYVR